MKTRGEKTNTYNPHVSVDCVLLSIVDDQLSVLLVERKDIKEDRVGYKLPGSLIYDDEDLDEAAYRVLNETTGLKRVSMKQFKAFGSPLRTCNEADVLWLERASKMKISRIVTIAYLALCKTGHRSIVLPNNDSVMWFFVQNLPELPFDHKAIIESAIEEIRHLIDMEPSILYSYLPSKFTAYQLRRAYELIYDRSFDVRNFHKKLNALEYIVLTDECERKVAHRAARYYRFDKVKYNKLRSRFNNKK